MGHASKALVPRFWYSVAHATMRRATVDGRTLHQRS
jgi:hypothetical protein